MRRPGTTTIDDVDRNRAVKSMLGDALRDAIAPLMHADRESSELLIDIHRACTKVLKDWLVSVECEDQEWQIILYGPHQRVEPHYSVRDDTRQPIKVPGGAEVKERMVVILMRRLRKDHDLYASVLCNALAAPFVAAGEWVSGQLQISDSTVGNKRIKVSVTDDELKRFTAASKDARRALDALDDLL
ncbi:MAG: hypothetical protein QGF59_24965 [Pirellulaceae bacterium]|nr:hypothetical protein [Pirellulaceae bacterium]